MSSEEFKGEGKQEKGKVQQTGEQAYTKAKEVGQQVTEKAKTTMQQVSERPETIAQPGRAESAANTGGKVIGAGLRKVANVIGGFAAGFSSGINAGKPQVPPQQMQQQQTKEAPQTYVTEEEKIEKKEIRQE